MILLLLVNILLLNLIVVDIAYFIVCCWISIPNILRILYIWDWYIICLWLLRLLHIRKPHPFLIDPFGLVYLLFELIELIYPLWLAPLCANPYIIAVRGMNYIAIIIKLFNTTLEMINFIIITITFCFLID